MTDPCQQIDTLDEIEKAVGALNTKYSVFIGLLCVFLVAVGFAGARSNTAVSTSQEAKVEAHRISEKQAVDANNDKWMRESINRLEKKLDKLLEANP